MRSLFFLLAPLAALSAVAAPLRVPDLPQPVTNNAVAAVVRDGRWEIFSFLGLGTGKTWRDTTNRAWAWREGDAVWQELPTVPVPVGRLAATACTVAGKIFLFGGYTVDEQGAEVSTPEVFRFDPADRTYTACAPMPTPVDDVVSSVYHDRYIFLVSGWHKNRCTTAVQIYDTQNDSWERGTEYPGTPVFGHAGGMSGATLVIWGGVRMLRAPQNGMKYAPSAECWLGEIDAEDCSIISWSALAPPANTAPLYRSAAVGVSATGGFMVFAGGTARPYNYNGIGYDRQPSEAVADVFVYDIARGEWREGVAPKDTATMDHRGLLEYKGDCYIVGGLDAQQAVTARVTTFPLPEAKK